MKLIKLSILAYLIFTYFSCAIFATSMTPAEVNETLPRLTKTEFYSTIQGEKAVKDEDCKILVKGREYAAPLGMTVHEDLKYGARGIDEWVEADGGNAYILINYRWENVGDSGATQLHLEFDTMLCE